MRIAYHTRLFSIHAMIVITLCAAKTGYGKNISDTKKRICGVETIRLIGKGLGIDVLEGNEDDSFESIEDLPAVLSAAYKINPTNPQQCIDAIIYNPEPDGTRADTLKFIIAIVDIARKKVVSSYQEGIEEDAGTIVEPGSLWIDTAPYNLAKDRRAFGVDFTSGYNPNCGNGDVGAVRTLYLREGGKIRPVLKGFNTSYWTFVQRGKDRCTGDDAPDSTIIENDSLSLILQNTSTNGFKDLTVSVRSSRDDGKKVMRKPFYFRLQYNGNEYPAEGLTEAVHRWMADE